MTGITAALATRLYTNDGFTGGGTGLTPWEINNFRISAAIDRLLIHLYNNSRNDNEFDNLCLSLSRHSSFV